MYKVATALTTFAVLAAVLAPAASAESPLLFGLDAAGVGDVAAAGAPADLGTLWIGPWTLTTGWGGPDRQFTALREAGVTPAIHFYYWGDDISRSCLSAGCWSSLHNTHKDQAGWQQLAAQLVDHLQSQMGGEPAYIFLETEFNKGDVQRYEPLDGMLADKATFIKAAYPAANVVLALGAWNPAAWSTWDQAAAASDSVGIQGMRGSTRDEPSHYRGLFESTVDHANAATHLFGKPIVVHDVALSSYPSEGYMAAQADELEEFFAGSEELKRAGVAAIVYRSWRDANMDVANYYGEAERHWGLADRNGAAKPAGQVWIDGVAQVRAAAQPATDFLSQDDQPAEPGVIQRIIDATLTMLGRMVALAPASSPPWA